MYKKGESPAYRCEKRMRIKVFQINLERDKENVCFRPLESVDQDNLDGTIYDLVYIGNINAMDMEDIRKIFFDGNLMDFHGRELSVSDIVWVQGNGSLKEGYYFIDSKGYIEVQFPEEQTFAAIERLNDSYQEKRRKMKEEAIKRLQILKVMDVVPQYLQKEDKLYYSERINSAFPAILYWLDNQPDWVDRIRQLESKYNIFIYHVVNYHASYGNILDCLYIGDDEYTWEEERMELYDGYTPIYAINLDIDEYSEFGYGQYCEKHGGVEKLQ